MSTELNPLKRHSVYFRAHWACIRHLARCSNVSSSQPPRIERTRAHVIDVEPIAPSPTLLAHRIALRLKLTVILAPLLRLSAESNHDSIFNILYWKSRVRGSVFKASLSSCLNMLSRFVIYIPSYPSDNFCMSQDRAPAR